MYNIPGGLSFEHCRPAFASMKRGHRDRRGENATSGQDNQCLAGLPARESEAMDLWYGRYRRSSRRLLHPCQDCRISTACYTATLSGFVGFYEGTKITRDVKYSPSVCCSRIRVKGRLNCQLLYRKTKPCDTQCDAS